MNESELEELAERLRYLLRAGCIEKSEQLFIEALEAVAASQAPASAALFALLSEGLNIHRLAAENSRLDRIQLLQQALHISCAAYGELSAEATGVRRLLAARRGLDRQGAQAAELLGAVVESTRARGALAPRAQLARDLNELGHSLLDCGEFERAREAFVEAQDRIRSLEVDLPLRALVSLGLARSYAALGSASEARATCEAALRELVGKVKPHSPILFEFDTVLRGLEPTTARS
jgi:tetratricopeptide (TPR) repeat protein